MSGSFPLPTYFVSHGGGPWPYMKDEYGSTFDELEASIIDIRRQVGTRPTAVLVISGHWTEPQFTVSSAAHPPMLYDYYGFPEHTYRVRYAAPGSPALAARVQQLLHAADLACELDAARGFDHGTFTLMQPLIPETDTPVVQLSLRAGLSPREHIAAGRALASLRDEGVLVLGSGLSYHNLRHMDRTGSEPSRRFDDWLQQTLVRSTPRDRSHSLTDWAAAPSARAAHPHADHLLPLMVAVGAAEHELGTCVYHQNDFMGSLTVSSFRFGNAADAAAS
jgi:aromatic ring-opening dioxygenase catalytic subunit (LigB family)